MSETANLTVTLPDGRFFTGNIAIGGVSQEESGAWALRLQGADYSGQRWDGAAITLRFVPGTPIVDD